MKDLKLEMDILKVASKAVKEAQRKSLKMGLRMFTLRTELSIFNFQTEQ
jgi:hypothetical protein